MSSGKALRYNTGKTMYHLLPPWSLEQVAKVFTYGAEKYQARNWESGGPWSTPYASMMRHLQAFWAGQDVDPESGLSHMSHAITNALFLLEYSRISPGGDDRPRISPKKVCLDIDGVLADFSTSFHKRAEEAGVNTDTSEDRYTSFHWEMFKEDNGLWDKLRQDKDFWLGLAPIEDGVGIPFEPIAYITNRSVPVEWSEEWLAKHRFPAAPVFAVKSGQAKADKLKELGADFMVEDNYSNYIKINEGGTCCFLYDRPHNAKYDVGFKRIKTLEDMNFFLR